MNHSTMSWCPAVSYTAVTTGTLKKLTLLFVLFLSVICASAQTAPPVNDECASAIPLLCGETLTGSTFSASPDFPPFCEPNPFNSGNGANGVWYYHVGTGAQVTIDMDFVGTTYDSYLNVYTGDCDNLVCLIGDDDSGAFAGPSIVTFFAEFGTTYLVYVTGYGTSETGASGDYEFQISCLPLCDPLLEISCPEDVEVDCGADISPAVLGSATFQFEACPGALGGDPVVEVSFYDDYINDGCPQVIARTWVAQVGNLVDMCTQTITLIDDEAPHFTYFPDDFSIQCSVASTEEEVLNYLDANVPFPTFEDNCSAIEVLLEVTSEISEDCPVIGVCSKTVTLIDGCGNSTSQTLTVTIIDTEGPVISGVEPEINVQCLEDVPGPANATAMDGCSGSEEVLVFTSNSGEPTKECSLTTAMGPGADWALWLPVLYNQGYVSSAQFVFDDNGGQLVQFVDGTAHLFGTLVNTVNPNEKFIADFWFENAADWATWSALGRGYKDDLGCAQPDLFEDWTYFELVNVASTLVGDGVLSGDVLNFYHMPSDYYFGFQLGQGANNKNCNYGFSGWFTYTGLVDGHHVEGHGDVNVDAECSDVFLDDCPNETSYTYIYHAIDDCDNATVVVQSIHVSDTTAPEFVNCPDNLEVQCMDEVPPLATGIEATDNCIGEVVVEYLGEVVEGDDCDMLITRTWSATDQCENRSYCIQQIMVHDETAPVFNSIPQEDITAECDNVPAPEVITAEDNCDDSVEVIYSESTEAGQCPNEYVIYRHWTVTDACGNTAQVNQVVHVQDTTPPVIELDAYIFLECNEVDEFMPEATDNCGSASIEIISQVLNSGGCIGVWQRIYHATDECGNTTTATQYISVQDNTPPTLVGVPGETTVECSEVNIQDNGNYCPPAEVVGVDDCGLPVTIEYYEEIVPTDDDCPQSFDVVRTWIATDACDNQSSATSICHVVDTTPPYFEFVPASVAIECDAEIPFSNAIAFDLCGVVTLSHLDAIIPGDCPQESWIERTFTAVDECGNSASAVQTIHIVDSTAPVMEGQDEIVIECGMDIPYIEPTAEDNCSGNISIVYEDYTSFLSPWYFYSTPGGNGFVDFSNLPGEITLGGSDGSNSEGENVDGTLGVFTASVATAKSIEISFDWNYTTNDIGGPAFDPFGYYVNEMLVQLTDNGGSDDQSGSATVVIPGGSLFALTTWATDNVFGDASVVISNISVVETDAVDCPLIDCILRQFTATDECGNSSVFNQFIIIQDTTGPIFSGDLELELPCDNYEGVFVTAMDECTEVESITFDDEFVSGTCQGHIIRTYTATDICGNESVFIQIITLVDEIAPVASFDPADFTVECGSFWDLIIPTFSDNCADTLALDSGSSEVSDGCTTAITFWWSATDNCGNSTVVDQVVTIVDTTAPEFLVVPANYTANCEDELIFDDAIAFDDCDNDLQYSETRDTIPGACLQSYTIVRHFTAVDNCLNAGEATQVITVVDQEAPVLVGEEEIIVECGDAIPYLEPSGTDNCGSVSISYADYSTISPWFFYSSPGGNGYVDFSSLPSQITIGGSDGDIQNDVYTASVTVAKQVEITFDWNYVTNDGDGSSFDPFGYFINDDFFQLTENDNYDPQSGNTTVLIPAGSTFGLAIVSTDNLEGNSMAVVSEISVVEAPLACPIVDCILRQFTATDDCGNSSLFNQFIVTYDTTEPTVNPYEVEIEMACDQVDYTVGITASDVCSEVTINFTDTFVSGTCQGHIIRDYVITDACNNTAYAQQIITLIDTVAPLLQNPVLDALVECGDELPDYSPVFIDNCDDELVILPASSIELLDCGYTIHKTWTATDNCGNQTIAVFNITVVDTTAPELSGEDDEFSIECNLAVLLVPPTASDACDEDVEITPGLVVIPGDCPNEYTEVFTWTATDDCANSSVRTIIVHHIDTTPPEFVTYPQGGVYSCEENPDFGTAIATDLCGAVEISFEDSLVTGECAYSYTIVRTWIATDACFNSSYAYSFYTIYDETPPTFDQQVLDVTVSCYDEVPAIPELTATDNCGVASVSHVSNVITSDNCGNTLIEVVYTAEDECGNYAVTSYTITVNDTIAPVLIGCPDDIVLECDGDIPAPSVVTATDNCDQDVDVSFEEFTYGDVPVEGQLADCDLLTPSIANAGNCAAAYNYTSWAMWLGGMPVSYKYYVALEGSFIQFEDGTAHLEVVLANANNLSSGFVADVWFLNGMDWTAWDNLPYPTGFKADCNGLDAEHINWTYYLMNNSAATLTGWGGYAGSFMTLTHAPSNNYFGYQVGLGANNVTPGYGSGGWFEYVGTLIDTPNDVEMVINDLPGVNNAGDFAFEHDCCPDYFVVREWCAMDCSGNPVCCTQTISFGEPVIQVPAAPQAEAQVTAVKDDFDFVTIHPNPANDHSIIEFTTKVDDQITMEAFDMSGRRVGQLFRGTVSAGENYRVDFNTSALQNGIYQVRLYSANDSRVKKLIIER